MNILYLIIPGHYDLLDVVTLAQMRCDCDESIDSGVRAGAKQLPLNLPKILTDIHDNDSKPIFEVIGR